MGAAVDEIAAYQTERVMDSAEMLADELKTGNIDMVTFTSSSTVKNFRDMLPPDLAIEEVMKNVVVASIGPITSDTARELGFTVHISADDFTIPGLCAAIEAYYLKK